MSFESGSVSYRMFYLPHALPGNYIDCFADTAAPILESAKAEPMYGWVTGRHLLDRDINEEHALYGGVLRMNLLEIERKIPSSLLSAELKMEELARLAATGKEFLSRREKTEMKKEVIDRLLPQMPPQLKAIPFVHQVGNEFLYSTATSDKQCETLAMLLHQTTSTKIFPLTPERIADVFFNTSTDMWQPGSFSDQVSAENVAQDPGLDFLTWLWFMAEKHDGMIQIPGSEEVGVLVEGPLTFVMEGSGAHETTLKKGMPTLSAEAKASLEGGKKLAKAKCSFSVKDRVWEVNFDAREFIFRSMKLPEPLDRLDPISKFQERFMALGEFRQMLFELYGMFIERRKLAKRWNEEVQAVRNWIKERPVHY